MDTPVSRGWLGRNNPSSQPENGFQQVNVKLNNGVETKRPVQRGFQARDKELMSRAKNTWEELMAPPAQGTDDTLSLCHISSWGRGVFIKLYSLSPVMK